MYSLYSPHSPGVKFIPYQQTGFLALSHKKQNWLSVGPQSPAWQASSRKGAGNKTQGRIACSSSQHHKTRQSCWCCTQDLKVEDRSVQVIKYGGSLYKPSLRSWYAHGATTFATHGTSRRLQYRSLAQASLAFKVSAPTTAMSSAIRSP